MPNGLRFHHEMKFMFRIRYCTGDPVSAIQCCWLLPPLHEYTEAMHILHQMFGRRSMIVRSVLKAVRSGGSQSRDNPETITEVLDSLTTYENTSVSMNCLDGSNCSSVHEIIARRLPTRLQTKWFKISVHVEEEGLQSGFDNIVWLVADNVNQTMREFASVLHPADETERWTSKATSSVMKASQGSGCSMECVVCADVHLLSECARPFQTSPMESLRIVERGRMCFYCLKDGHTHTDYL